MSVIRYWLKFIALDNRKSSKIVYDMMLNDQIMYPNVNNWASRVKRILENLGFNFVWLNQGVGCPKAFLKVFSQRVRDNFMQTWQTKLNDSTRASIYTFFFRNSVLISILT